jgi:hypothetical protein
MRPPTSREALAHLVSWREPDAQQPGTAPAVPYWHPASGRWVLGYLPDAHLTDAACYDLLFSDWKGGADALAAWAERLGCPSWGGWVNKE